MIIRRLLFGLFALLGALVVTGYAVLAAFDLNEHKGEISAAVEDLTGRKLVIAGRLSWSVSFGIGWPTPVVVGKDLSLGNSSWGSAASLLEIDRLEVGFDLWKLIFGTFDAEYFLADQGILQLEKSQDGQVNWDLPIGQEEVEQTEDYLGGDFPYLRRGTITSLSVRFSEPGQENRLTGEIDQLDVSVQDRGNLLSLALDGQVNKQPVIGRGELTALRSLALGRISPLKLDLQLKDSRLSLSGTTGERDGESFLSVSFEADGPKIASLAKLLTLEWPEVGDFKASGHLAVTGQSLDLTKLKASLGPSDLAGSVAVDFDAPGKATVNLTASEIDVTPFLGGATLESDQDVVQEEPATKDEPAFVFGTEPLPFDVLPEAQSVFDLKARKVVVDKLTFDDVAVKGKAGNKSLELESFHVGFDGASIKGSAQVDDSTPPMASLDLLTQDFDLGTYLKDHDVTDLVVGKIDVGLKIRGTGSSPRELVSGLNGHAGVVMGDGKIASRYVDLIATDLLQFIMPWKKNVDETIIKCALVQFEITDGLAKSQSMLFDTQNITMSGQGTIDLTSEKVDFSLRPRPKDPTLISLATGLRVTGTLLDTHVSVDPLSLAVEAAEGTAGVLLLGPAGILIPFVSLGAGHNHPCVNDLQKVFGKSLSDKSLTNSSGDKTSPATANSDSSDAPPLEVLLPASGTHITPDQLASYLEDLGYEKVANVTKEGNIFHADADWKGRPLRLRIDSRLDKIEVSDR
ncbi:MAG: AsmA family protein [Pseudomonadota bacterium]